MRRRVTRAAALLAVALFLVACVGTPTVTAPATLAQVTCEEFEAAGATTVERSLVVSVGGSFDVILCSNPSTDFAWEEPTWDGDAGIELDGRSSAQPADAPPGTAGRETFTFSTTDLGTSRIRFTYSQPWDGGTKGAWSVQLDVTVE